MAELDQLITDELDDELELSDFNLSVTPILNAKQTIRKRAFYLIYESLVRTLLPLEVVAQHRTLKAENITRVHNDLISDEVVAIIRSVEQHFDSLCQVITVISDAKRLETIAKTDLAILLVLITEMQFGIALKVAVTEGIKLADEYGGTDKSAGFIQAILAKIPDKLLEITPNLSTPKFYLDKSNSDAVSHKFTKLATDKPRTNKTRVDKPRIDKPRTRKSYKKSDGKKSTDNNMRTEKSGSRFNNKSAWQEK